MDAKTIQRKDTDRASMLMVLMVLLLLAAGCGRMQAAQPVANSNYTLALSMQPDPPRMGPVELLITLHDLSGKGVDGARLHVEGNMTHVGMTPVLADVQAGQDGRYAVPFKWTMEGDWIVTVAATLPGGTVVTERFPIRVGK